MYKETYNNILPIFSNGRDTYPFVNENIKEGSSRCPPSMNDKIQRIIPYLIEPGSPYITRYNEKSLIDKVQFATHTTMYGKYKVWHCFVCIENTLSKDIFDDSGSLDITTSTTFMPTENKKILHRYKLNVGDMICWSAELPAFLNKIKSGYIIFISARVLIENPPILFKAPYVEDCKCVLCIYHNEFNIRDLKNALRIIGCNDIINIVIDYAILKNQDYRSECCCGFASIDNPNNCSICYEQFVKDTFMDFNEYSMYD